MLILLLLVASRALGSRLIAQEVIGGMFGAEIAVGTPPQKIPVTVAFSDDHLRIMKREMVAPFTPRFDQTTSTSFRPIDDLAWDTVEVGNLKVDAPFFHFTTSAMIDAHSGSLGLSPNSWIANKYLMEIQTETVSEGPDGPLANGFSIGFGSDSAEGRRDVRSVSVPIIKTEAEWAIKASVSIKGHSITPQVVVIDPAHDYIVIPSKDVSSLFKIFPDPILSTRNGVNVGKIQFPCNNEGTIKYPPFYMELFDPEGSKLIDIEIPLKCKSAPLDGYCESIFQADREGDKVRIGRSILDGRHSVVFDAPAGMIRFNEYFPRKYLHAAKPVKVGFVPLNGVRHGANYRFSEESGLVFPPVSTGGYFLGNVQPKSLVGPRGELILQYLFLCLFPPCGQTSYMRELPDLYHIATPGYEFIANRATREAILGLSPAMFSILPIFRISVMASPEHLLIVAQQTREWTVDFESLKLSSLVPSEEDIDCSICQECSPGSPITQIDICKHVFHICCVKQWATEKRSCPLCRAEIGVKPNSRFRKILTQTTTPIVYL